MFDGQRGRAAGAGDALVGQRVLQRIGAETPSSCGIVSPRYPASCISRKFWNGKRALAIDASARAANGPASESARAMQLRLALGLGVVHAVS